MFSLAAVGIAVAAGIAASAGPVAAEPGNNGNEFTVNLNCADGRVLTGRSIEQNHGRPFLIEETTGVLVQMRGSYLNLDAPQEPAVVFQDTPGNGLQLLTCTYDILFGGAHLRVTGGFLDTTH
jgi:hypothetical protein